MNTCSVCLNDISFNDVCNTNCNHDFCEKCLDEWFKRNKITCPLCRGIITYYKKSDTITKLYFNNNTNDELLKHLFIQNINLKKYICFSCMLLFIQLYYISDNYINYNHLKNDYHILYHNYTIANQSLNTCKEKIINTIYTYLFDTDNRYWIQCMIPKYFLDKCF